MGQDTTPPSQGAGRGLTYNSSTEVENTLSGCCGMVGAARGDPLGSLFPRSQGFRAVDKRILLNPGNALLPATPSSTARLSPSSASASQDSLSNVHTHSHLKTSHKETDGTRWHSVRAPSSEFLFIFTMLEKSVTK